LRGKLLVEPQVGELLGDPKADSMHVINRKAPDIGQYSEMLRNKEGNLTPFT